MSDEKIWEYEHEAYKYWDKFYGIHENKYIDQLLIISLNFEINIIIFNNFFKL